MTLHALPSTPAEPDLSWMDEAACADLDPGIFFGEDRHHDYGPARKVCAGCPVKDTCCLYAIDNGFRYGMFGGLTPRERHTIDMARRRQRRGAS